MSNNIPVKEIGEMLDEVSTKVPKLISALLGTLYSADAGKNMGMAVGNMYKELIEAGIPKDAALEMSKDYINTLKGITDSINTNN